MSLPSLVAFKASKSWKDMQSDQLLSCRIFTTRGNLKRGFENGLEENPSFLHLQIPILRCLFHANEASTCITYFYTFRFVECLTRKKHYHKCLDRKYSCLTFFWDHPWIQRTGYSTYPKNVRLLFFF